MYMHYCIIDSQILSVGEIDIMLVILQYRMLVVFALVNDNDLR